jgi:1,4-dihydroxy-2-naphthoate octaprenyltransferase
VVGVASVLAGYFYTAGPISYGRRGLGEVVVFVFMGLIMVQAAAFVQVERLTWAAAYTSLPVAILVANILHANNLRDIDNDRAARKVTIATLSGRPAADYGIWGLILCAYGAVLVTVALGGLPLTSLLVVLSLPAAWSTLQALKERDAVALNALVRGAARLHLRFGFLLAIGLLIDALI